jgi:hypothetical protein
MSAQIIPLWPTNRRRAGKSSGDRGTDGPFAFAFAVYFAVFLAEQMLLAAAVLTWVMDAPQLLKIAIRLMCGGTLSVLIAFTAAAFGFDHPNWRSRYVLGALLLIGATLFVIGLLFLGLSSWHGIVRVWKLVTGPPW